MTNTEAETADWLLTPEAVRSQCRALYKLGLSNKLEHFSLVPARLEAAADLVCAVTKQNYPSLDIPPHARWRHFVIDGSDRWATIRASLDCDAAELARIECELAILSVLLDAGAGPDWRYRDRMSGKLFARSEGLALASLDMYVSGAFCADAMRADAKVMSAFSATDLTLGFQVDEDNILAGLTGRAALIANLGDCVTSNAAVFGSDKRLGNIADYLAGLAEDNRLAARDILITILHVIGPIWPGRQEMAGRNLGDCWEHGKAPSPGLVPFHKLSQWLTYSLFEPLERAGFTITGQDALTGLAEYRNGGLFIDTGALQLRDPGNADVRHEPASELVVEWRALTVVLLDELADLVRAKLGKTAQELPLAAVLEGGTWAAGRQIAAERRTGGVPPIAIASDGSVF